MTRILSEGADLLKGPVQMRTGLGVHGDHVRPCVGKRLNIFLWFDDHEVDIDDALGRGADSLHDQRANRDVRHESAVHHVHEGGQNQPKEPRGRF